MSKGSEQGKLFVGGLSWDTDKDGLQGYFSRFGKVIDCIVMKNNITGKSRGFGFVTYEDPACVETVLSSGTHHLDGRQVDPKACNPKGSQPPRGPRNDSGGGRGGPNMRRGGGGNDKSRKIFVGGLPNSADEEALKAAFSRFGTVTDVVIMFDQQKNRSRGFGFLTFENEDSVEAVVKDRYVDVCNKQVECKRAEPRNENRDGGNWGAPGGNQWNHGGPHGHQGGGYGGGGYQDFNQGGGNNFNQFQGGYGQQQGWGPQGGQGGWMQNSQGPSMGGYGNQPPQGNYQSPPQGGPPQQGGFNQWQQSPQPSGPPPQGPNSGNYGYGTPAAQSYGAPQQPAAAPAHAPAQQSFGDYGQQAPPSGPGYNQSYGPAQTQAPAIPPRQEPYAQPAPPSGPGYGNTQTPAAAPPTDPAAAQNTGYNYGNQYGNMGNYQQDQSSYGPTRGYQQPQANGAAQGYNQAAYTAPQQGGYSTDGMSGYAGAQNTSYGQGDAGGAGGYGSPPQNRMPPAATSPVGGYHPYRRT